jgi:hypothetical protein
MIPVPRTFVVMPAEAGIQYPLSSQDLNRRWLLGPRLRGGDTGGNTLGQ